MARERDAVKASTTPQPGQPRFDLQLAIVHYADSPDRCTLFPQSADDVALMATWLSVDRDLLVDLEGMR